MVNCIVPYCNSRKRKDKSISFHEFPVDDNLRRIWLQNISKGSYEININDKSNSSRVCCKHFTNEDYIPGRKIKMLKKGAVPTVFERNSTSGNQIVRRKLCRTDDFTSGLKDMDLKNTTANLEDFALCSDDKDDDCVPKIQLKTYSKIEPLEINVEQYPLYCNENICINTTNKRVTTINEQYPCNKNNMEGSIVSKLQLKTYSKKGPLAADVEQCPLHYAENICVKSDKCDEYILPILKFTELEKQPVSTIFECIGPSYSNGNGSHNVNKHYFQHKLKQKRFMDKAIQTKDKQYPSRKRSLCQKVTKKIQTKFNSLHFEKQESRIRRLKKILFTKQKIVASLHRQVTQLTEKLNHYEGIFSVTKSKSCENNF